MKWTNPSRVQQNLVLTVSRTTSAADAPADRRRGMRIGRRESIQVNDPQTGRGSVARTLDVGTGGMRVEVPTALWPTIGAVLLIRHDRGPTAVPPRFVRVVWVDGPESLRLGGTVVCGVEYLPHAAAVPRMAA